MKKTNLIKLYSLLAIAFCMLLTTSATHAESLFSLNATQRANFIEPKPLFGSVNARGIGDVLTILLTETPTMSDKGTYQTEKNSSLLENVTNTVNQVLSTHLKEGFDGMNGEISVKGSTATQRQIGIKDTVAVQVVQVLPNGTLLVQGKKTLVNANERVDLLVSGIVDPRWINQSGEISSKNVANLQFAMSGSGTVSRGQNEGFITRFFRMIF